ncbi:MAG: hypothetical protein JNM56_00090 [Planctomycetia bacterium]|nr:hypothetical protein [Planctomycetia bacterium]
MKIELDDDPRDIEDPEEYVGSWKKEIVEAQKRLKSLGLFLADEEAKANRREKHIKSISQAKWFIKIQKGVSDTLKAKCIPLNKKTTDLIKELNKQCLTLLKGTLACVNATKDIGGDMRNAQLKLFIKHFNESVGLAEDFDTKARKDVDAATTKEETAVAALDNYIKAKDKFKELGADEYKAFKKMYEDIAKTL